MGNLTEHFSEVDFVVSAKFPKLAEATRAWVTPADKYKMFLLAKFLLQPIRNWIQLPVVITSGYCNSDLNEALKRNISTTDHDYDNHDQTANAVDYVVMENNRPSPGKTHMTFDWAKKALVYGQIIHYPKRGSAHITLPTPHHYMDYMVLNI